MNTEYANPSTLLAYKDFKLCVLQAIERIQADEDANRRLEAFLPSSAGGVYFAWSNCLNCMKIGATRREDPQLRLREISRYVTTPFELIAWAPTSIPFRLEKVAHRYFKEEQINTRGSGAGTEFFCISAADVDGWFERLPQLNDELEKKKRENILRKLEREETKRENMSRKLEKEETKRENMPRKRLPTSRVHRKINDYQERED